MLRNDPFMHVEKIISDYPKYIYIMYKNLIHYR